MDGIRSFEETHRTSRRWSVVDEIMAGIGLGIVLFLCAYMLWLA